MRYCSIDRMLNMIDEPNASRCKKLFLYCGGLFKKAPGSKHNHQAWRGGYLGHIQEVMNIARNLYSCLNSIHPLPFSLSEALLVLFLHDLEKPWKYEFNDEVKLTTKSERLNFRMQKLEEYEIILTPEQKNAMKYVECEGNDYRNDKRVMNELAAFCHMCDVASARIWFDYPKPYSYKPY